MVQQPMDCQQWIQCTGAQVKGTAVDGIAGVLALSPEESLGTKAGVGTLGIFADTLAKPVRSGSFWFDGCNDSLIALLVNDCLDNTFALLCNKSHMFISCL